MPIYTNTANDSNTYDVLIIGAGPAGLTASIYLKRANYKVAFIEKGVPGGKIVNTPIITNYPGFENIFGADLALKMYEQANNIGVKYIYGNVTGFEKQKSYFVVFSDDGSILFAKALIIATGTIDNKLGIKDEEKFKNKGISYCAVCDGTFAKNKKVAVIGGGNSALTNALYLSSICKYVYLINRNENFKDNENFIKSSKKIKNIEIINNSKLTEIFGTKNIDGIKVKNLKNLSEKKYDVEYIFVYVGSNPATEFINQTEILNKNNIIETDSEMKTKIPGLFAAGDVNKISNRQITVATSDGTIAALSAIKFLKTWE